MSTSLPTFVELTKLTYIDQAKWFLNGFWDEGLSEKESENVWKFTQKFIELDHQKKKEGNELDEFMAHKFLETQGETLTVVKMREQLRKIDIDNNGKVALLEYLAFKYGKNPKDIINSPQGSNQKEVEEAQAKLQAVQDAYVEVQNQLDQQTKALEEQKVAQEAAEKALASQREAEDSSKKALEAQQTAEQTVRNAEEELKNAINDLKSQEDAYANKVKELEDKSKDPNVGTVSKNKAAAELSQLKQEDPLPLRKAKITQEAALRKVEKERKAAESATAAAQEKLKQAEDATRLAEESAQEADRKTKALAEQKERVEEAFRDAETKLEEAKQSLEEVKKKGGSPKGAIWWMTRELIEAEKYKPKKKQTLQSN